MLEPQEKEIDGHRYRFLPLTIKPARQTLDMLIQKLGPSTAAAVRGLKNAGSFDPDEHADNATTAVLSALPAVAESFGDAIESFARVFDSAFHDYLVKTFFPRVEVRTQDNEGREAWPRLSSDLCANHFATNLMSELKVLCWCMEVQYSDFFEPLKRASLSLAWSRAQRRRPHSDSQKDSIGTSSESPQASATGTR